MDIVVAGLGLIGGSMAKALKQYTSHTVYGWNRTQSVARQALSDGAIDGIADDDVLSRCDILIPVLYPTATIEFLQRVIPAMKPGALVVDLVGVKSTVVAQVAPLAKQHGIRYVGGHPMAGLAKAGYERAFAEMYQGANMILVPTVASDQEDLNFLTQLFTQVGFGHIEICDGATHDKMIAHTSQLAHIVSNSYVKSPASLDYIKFAGGSYRDMTRIACLNEMVWKELFLCNREAILAEIDLLMQNIGNLRSAIHDRDEARLEAILREGRLCKEAIEQHTGKDPIM